MAMVNVSGLPKLIEELLKQTGWSLSVAATNLGVTWPTINHWRKESKPLRMQRTMIEHVKVVAAARGCAVNFITIV